MKANWISKVHVIKLWKFVHHIGKSKTLPSSDFNLCLFRKTKDSAEAWSITVAVREDGLVGPLLSQLNRPYVIRVICFHNRSCKRCQRFTQRSFSKRSMLPSVRRSDKTRTLGGETYHTNLLIIDGIWEDGLYFNPNY